MPCSIGHENHFGKDWAKFKGRAIRCVRKRVASGFKGMEVMNDEGRSEGRRNYLLLQGLRLPLL
jgi:hypothetical protein